MSSSYSIGLNSDSGNELTNPFLHDSSNALGPAASNSSYTESDSDYRDFEGFDETSVAGNAPIKQIPQNNLRTLLRNPGNKRLLSNPLGLSIPPSRPLSQASSMSGVSTTAFKDGVEGNRPQRFADPQEYSTWINSTISDNDDPNFLGSDIALDNGEDRYSFYNQPVGDGTDELNSSINVKKPTPVRPNQNNNDQSYNKIPDVANPSPNPSSLSDKVQSLSVENKLA
jgi:hypothetical protein